MKVIIERIPPGNWAVCNSLFIWMTFIIAAVLQLSLHFHCCYAIWKEEFKRKYNLYWIDLVTFLRGSGGIHYDDQYKSDESPISCEIKE